MFCEPVNHLRRWEESHLTLTVKSMETWSTGVTVVPGETRFTDAGPSPGIRPAGVVHGAGGAALAVCAQTEQCSRDQLKVTSF